MKGLFLDMDGTVTESRTKITEEMKEILSHFDPVIVSGQDFPHMKTQLGNLECYILSQNGNHGVLKDGKELWRYELTKAEKSAIFEHALTVLGKDKMPEDFFEDRGCQCTLSFVGHHIPVEIKKKFDPTSQKRKDLLQKFPAPKGIEVKIGGTSSIDYFREGYNKGFFVKKFMDYMGYDSAIYIGDKLFPGGNDETVIGVCETISVKDPKETLEVLKKLESK